MKPEEKWKNCKKTLLESLLANLENLTNKSNFYNPLPALEKIESNERIVLLIQKIDKKLTVLSNNHTSSEENGIDETINQLVIQCSELQNKFENHWEYWTKDFKRELNSLEIHRQLKAQLKKRKI